MSRIALEYWRTWLARSRGRESTSISSTSPRRTALCSGPRTSPSSALHSASRVERSTVLLRLAAGAANQPPPVGRAEDEDQRQRAEDRRPGRDRDLLAHRVGEHRDRTRADQGRDEERLLCPRPAGGEGQQRRDGLHAHHQQHVLERTPDVEGLEEE